MNSLLLWTRSDPHRQRWKNFLRDSGGTGFWHETYTMRGGMEAIYGDIAPKIGFMSFAPVVPARGSWIPGIHYSVRVASTRVSTGAATMSRSTALGFAAVLRKSMSCCRISALTGRFSFKRSKACRPIAAVWDKLRETGDKS
jgi:hypothetical protein